MGIQISGLLANSAFDWKSVVDQLIAADSIPITNLQNEQAQNLSQVAALGQLNTMMQDLQNSVQAIRSNNPFENRTVASDNAASTWKATSTAGAAVGTYSFDVQTLATATTMTGGAHVGQNLNATSADLSGLTVNSLPTALQVTSTAASGNPETFTVNGQTIQFQATDSLKSVLDNITTQTGGDVTWAYNSSADGITLTSQSGSPIILGSAGDNSNFLQVMKLQSTSSTASSVSSYGTLGTASATATLVNARLATPISGVDSSGNGSFTINGASISYNVNTDTISSVIGKINSSAAGVTASFDSTNDRLVLTNNKTGVLGVSASDTTGTFLSSLNLASTSATQPTTKYGTNAVFSLDGGNTWKTSQINTLDSTVTGITGLSVTVNTTGTQTLTVAADTASMQSSIQDFLTKFNALQDQIAADTQVSNAGGSITTSILSSNHDVGDWSTQLEDVAFKPIAGLTGTVTHLDDLGIDFDGTTGHLIIKDQGKLGNALTNHPDDVQSFFLSGTTGFVSQMYDKLTNLQTDNNSQQANLNQNNTDIDNQITTMQTRLSTERDTLTQAFIQMLDAQQSAQSQSQSLTNAFFSGSNSSCWVARAVYGENNPRWLLFRHWLLSHAPGWFRALYLRYGEQVARHLQGRRWLHAPIRRWMDSRIARITTL
ncbi:MAG TPA: flagellar filament capping protein FliD [Opitutaceae bacterium]|nr:flagellar filament capping protein FliD [Opitutaceae bacterium]